LKESQRNCDSLMEYLGTMENFIDMAGGESAGSHKKRK
jgi:hypothetical protein